MPGGSGGRAPRESADLKKAHKRGTTHRVECEPTHPEVMLRDAKHKEPKSGVQIGPGNTITIQSGVGTPTTINVLSFGKNGALLAAGKDFGRVVVWDVANKKFLCAVETGQGIVHAVAISPDGQTDRKSTRLNSSHGYISYA